MRYPWPRRCTCDGLTASAYLMYAVGGEILVRHKELTKLDAAELRARAAEVDRRVLGRIGAAPAPAWPVR